MEVSIFVGLTNNWRTGESMSDTNALVLQLELLSWFSKETISVSTYCSDPHIRIA
jgi:hypothetical protein